MKILVADKFEKSGLEGLQACGFEVLFQPDLKDDSLAKAIEDEKPEGLIVRSTVVEARHLGDSLKLIVRAGAGYNNIDVKAAAEKGIKVSNCPGKNSHAVAELAIGLMIAIDRRIPDNVSELRAGHWNKKEFSKAKGLYGMTLGIIGMGNIGADVSKVARAMGMKVMALSLHVGQEGAKALGIQLAKDAIELAKSCDVVSVHCALNSDTRGMLNGAFFEAMKPGAYFINTSRAEVLDQSALENAIATKGIRAGLDVFDGEPDTGEAEYNGSLRNNPMVYCTHHIGASTEQAQEAVAAETVRIFQVFAKTGIAENAVN